MIKIKTPAASKTIEKQMLSEAEFSKILDYISRSIGIVPIEAHKDGIRKFVESRLNLLQNNSLSYSDFVSTSPEESQLLVDAATVNETYFFREQKQFELLKQEILPKLAAKKGKINIWSAACSSGEEPYSLLLLAENQHLITKITASDINSLALEKCRKGIYKKTSVKTFDGNLFNPLVKKYWQESTQENINGAYVLPDAVKNQIEFKKLNLMDLCNPEKSENIDLFPKNQDIIFARNVFIYFPRQTKQKVLKQLAENCLEPGGYLFVSMNETAGIDRDILPECLERKAEGSVFYFQKKADKAPAAMQPEKEI